MNNFIRVNTVRPQLARNQNKENQTHSIPNQILQKHTLIHKKEILREFGKDLSNISTNLSVNTNILDPISKNYKRTSDLINKITKNRRILRKDVIFPKIKNYQFKQGKKCLNFPSTKQNLYTSINTTSNITITEPDVKTEKMEIDTNISVSAQIPKHTLQTSVIREDPQQCFDYLDEIYEYLKSIDSNNLPLENYMETVQNDITEKMRSILLDWLVEVHLKFKLLPETFYLTVNIIDRYLSKQSINRKYLQLLGVTAMFIACKYEEIYSPEIKDFIYMTDNAYTRDQMIKMEFDVLKELEFNITNPSPLRFVEILKNNLKFDEKNFFLCQFFLESCITNYKMIKYSPNILATCTVYIVEKLKRNTLWNDNLEHTLWNMSGINKEDPNVKECLKNICVVIGEIEKTKYVAIKKKYSLTKFHEVGKINIIEENGLLL